MGSRSAQFPLYAAPPPKIDWVTCGERLYVDSLLAQSLDAHIYRYATLAEAFGLVSRREWTFARPSQWPDKYEKHIAEELFEANRLFADMVGFVKCVSLEHSSEAMWRTYSSTGGLVRLSWSLADLLTTLQQATWPSKDKIYVAPVRYLSAPKLRAQIAGFMRAKPSGQNAKRALLMKRDGFAFENEIRISVVARTIPGQFLTAKAVSSERIDRILVDPYLRSWQAEEICRMFKDVLKVKARVEQSKFDTVFKPTSPVA